MRKVNKDTRRNNGKAEPQAVTKQTSSATQETGTQGVPGARMCSGGGRLGRPGLAQEGEVLRPSLLSACED